MATTKVHEWKEIAKGLKVGQGIRLNDRHRAFIAEYIQDWDATRAARVVGYKNPEVSGKGLVDGKICPDVARAISRIQARNEESAVISSEEIRKHLSNLVESDITDALDRGWIIVADPKKLPKSFRQCMKKVDVETIYLLDENGEETEKSKVKFELYDKMKAYELLMKSMGMFAPDQVKVSFDWDTMFDPPIDDDLEFIDGKVNEPREKKIRARARKTAQKLIEEE